MSSSTGHTSRPLPISGGLSFVAGIGAVLFVAHSRPQLVVLGIVLGGLGAIAVGVEARHRSYGLVGSLLAIVGFVVVLAGIGRATTLSTGISPTLEVLPGIVGLVLLVLGLGAALPGYERWFVSAGTGAILLSVFVGGLVYDASAPALVAGTAATVFAWDLGEQAINAGEQIGRQATTWEVELAHAGVTLFVGLVSVIVAISIYSVSVNELPVVGLWTLFGAGVVLAALLYT